MCDSHRLVNEADLVRYLVAAHSQPATSVILVRKMVALEKRETRQISVLVRDLKAVSLFTVGLDRY